VKLRWNGDEGVVCLPVGAETGKGDELKPGVEYPVSDALGESLLRSHAGWEPVDKKAKDARKRIDDELAGEQPGEPGEPEPEPEPAEDEAA
jgi:hypothetical protein